MAGLRFGSTFTFVAAAAAAVAVCPWSNSTVAAVFDEGDKKSLTKLKPVSATPESQPSWFWDENLKTRNFFQCSTIWSKKTEFKKQGLSREAGGWGNSEDKNCSEASFQGQRPMATSTSAATSARSSSREPGFARAKCWWLFSRCLPGKARRCQRKVFLFSGARQPLFRTSAIVSHLKRRKHTLFTTRQTDRCKRTAMIVRTRGKWTEEWDWNANWNYLGGWRACHQDLPSSSCHLNKGLFLTQVQIEISYQTWWRHIDYQANMNAEYTGDARGGGGQTVPVE